MGRQRSALGTISVGFGGAGVCRCLPDSNGAAPFIERIENIRFAKSDLDGTAPRTFCVVAIEVAIDAFARDLQRDTALRPFADLFERGSDDPDEMPVVLATEVR